MSRVGKLSIILPDKVQVEVRDGQVQVEGPKGKLSQALLKNTTVKVENGSVTVTREADTGVARAAHGTMRALINNMVTGVSKGFQKSLEIHGVGFRAAVKGAILDLSVGKSHPVHHPIPAGLTVAVNENTKISVEGIDKQLVGQFASDVRSYYPPEPYKGKGIRYTGEQIRRKAGKSVQK